LAAHQIFPISCDASGDLSYEFQRGFLRMVEGEYVTGGEQRLQACANRALRQGSSRSQTGGVWLGEEEWPERRPCSLGRSASDLYGDACCNQWSGLTSA
jgi:hypothetical protein